MVAIIGILAAVGLTGYQLYISNTRDAVTRNSQDFIQRAIDIDVIALRNNVSSRSDFAQGFPSNDWCFRYRDRVIRGLNVDNEKINQFTGKAFACDGNGMADNLSIPASGQLSIPRGNIMMACQNPTSPVTAESFGFYTCSCTGQDVCLTQPRPRASLDGALSPGDANAMIELDSGVDATIMNQILLTGQLSIEVGLGVRVGVRHNGCTPLGSGRYSCSIAPGATAPAAPDNASVIVVAESNNICWTPDPHDGDNLSEMYEGCMD